MTERARDKEKQEYNAAMQRAEQSMRRGGMLPQRGGLLLCAVSGGLDSVSLLYFLRELSRREGFRLAAAHYDHGLRGAASEEDARFVQELCADWGVPCIVEAGDVRRAAAELGCGIEEAARSCRYDFLRRTAEALGAERVATAHQAEDNAETVLYQLIRGSAGITGIPPVRGLFVRPFLTVSRREIERYAEAHHLSHREDASNRDLRYARNRIRHTVLPELEQIHAGAAEAICRAAAVQRREDQLLRRIAAAELGGTEQERGGVSAPRERFLQTEPALIPRMLGLLLEQAELGRRDVTARHFAAMEELVLHGREGASLSLPGGCVALRRGRVLALRRAPQEERAALWPGGSLIWGDHRISCEKREKNFPEKADTILLKYDMIALPITVGPWDRHTGLTLPGSRGRRSLKRLFAERGISAEERERTPVFYTGGRLCAAAGIGTDEAFLPREGEEALVLITEKIEREQLWKT